MGRLAQTVVRSPVFAAVIVSGIMQLQLLVSQPLASNITLDGTLGPSGTLAGPDFEIPDSLGTRKGNNLFHSFGNFDLSAGEAATFSNAGAPLNNVIGRITGGTPSSIDGTIRSTIPGANLYLLNPSGIIFGPTAALDVMGSFHASTADYLKFDGGETFYANPAANSILSVANPTAFGFLAATPAAITGQGAYLSVPEGATLSVIGGELDFSATKVTPDEILWVPAVLSAPGGRINLASLASPGEVDAATMNTGSATLGKVTFSEGAKLSVTNQDIFAYPLASAGSVYIRGGEMIFRDGGIDAYGNPGGTADIKGGSLWLDNYYAFAANFNWYYDQASADLDHPGTAFNIDLVGDLVMTHASLLDAQNIGAGNGGNIKISAANLLLGDAAIDDNSYVDGIGYYGYIGTVTTGDGKGGDLAIRADNMTVRNGFFVNAQVYVDDYYLYGEGDSGNISLKLTDTLRISDQGTVGIKVFGHGQGGLIDIVAKEIVIDASNEAAVTNLITTTGILGQAGYLSDGGTINLSADRLSLLNGGQISSVLYDEGYGYGAYGKGTDVYVNAREILISGYAEDVRYEPLGYVLSSIDARVYGAEAYGEGGNLFIATDTLKLENGGNIRTGLYYDAPGNAGDIVINADEISIASLGQIYADSFRGTGNSGDITLNAGSLAITGTGNAAPPEPLDFTFTGMSTTTDAGRGGTINATLEGDLILTSGGGIKADTQGDGSGGAIDIAARNIRMGDTASINAASTGSGDAGDIVLTAGDTLEMRAAAITTAASVDADGGNITISAPNLVYLYGSKITSSVGGGPETTGGNITIDPRYVVLNNSQIVANAFAGTGGNIRIVANTFLADPSSVVDASSQLGVSGTVDIQAPVTSISGLVNPLSSAFTSASALLKERCLARIRSGGRYSSFVVGGRDGLPIEPGNLLPATVF